MLQSWRKLLYNRSILRIMVERKADKREENGDHEQVHRDACRNTQRMQKVGPNISRFTVSM